MAWRSGNAFHLINEITVRSAFCPSGVGKSSTGRSSWDYGVARSPVSGGR